MAMGMDWQYCVPYPCSIVYRHGMAKISVICLLRRSRAVGHYKHVIFYELEVQSRPKRMNARESQTLAEPFILDMFAFMC